MNMIFLLLNIICLLISVSFLTLLEQKGLSLIQLRKGPNKLGFLGIFQPFSDAIKLFLKENIKPIYSNYLIYLISPICSLFISLSIWLMFPYYYKFIQFNNSMIYMICVLSLGVYPIMLSGWSSNSNYSLLGSMRAIAQTISYEVCLILIFLNYLMLIYSMNFIKLSIYQENIYFIFINIPMSFIFLIILMAETNRAPFDFSEGESELVSGFNIEYSGGGFVLIFLAEYMMILFMSMLYVIFLMNNNYMINFLFFLKILFLSFFFIWIRASLPRFRYDKLMYLSWKKFLPISLNFLIFIISILMF